MDVSARRVAVPARHSSASSPAREAACLARRLCEYGPSGRVTRARAVYQIASSTSASACGAGTATPLLISSGSRVVISYDRRSLSSRGSSPTAPPACRNRPRHCAADAAEILAHEVDMLRRRMEEQVSPQGERRECFWSPPFPQPSSGVQQRPKSVSPEAWTGSLPGCRRRSLAAAGNLFSRRR